MKINVEKWDAERVELETRIKELKKSIRKEPKQIKELRYVNNQYVWVPTGGSYIGGSCEEYSELAGLKYRATGLYCLRAALRNKEHTATVSKEEALTLLNEFALPEAA